MSDGCNCCFYPLLILGATLFFIYRKFFANKGDEEVKIHEENFKKDVVYLYQFPRAPEMPNISPFCLKVEVFLRLHNIKYETRSLLAGRSQYGRLPFIELNGKQIADTKIIEQRLKEHFNITPMTSERDEAIARAVCRMLDQHTFFVMCKFKVLDSLSSVPSFIVEQTRIPNFLKKYLRPLAAMVFQYAVRKRIRFSLGLFSDAEFNSLLREDLDTIKHILGDQKFLFGDKMTSADCTVFGHLAITHYKHEDNMVRSLFRADYPTFGPYFDRIRQQLFPDDFEIKK